MGGDQASEIDCVLFGFLTTILYTLPEDNTLRIVVEKRLGNLLQFTKRMKNNVYPDWDDIIGNNSLTEVKKKEEQKPARPPPPPIAKPVQVPVKPSQNAQVLAKPAPNMPVPAKPAPNTQVPAKPAQSAQIPPKPAQNAQVAPKLAQNTQVPPKAQPLPQVAQKPPNGQGSPKPTRALPIQKPPPPKK